MSVMTMPQSRLQKMATTLPDDHDHAANRQAAPHESAVPRAEGSRTLFDPVSEGCYD
jgi:hypothetical protein